MTAPETSLRARLLAVLATEFSAESLDVRDDKIHDSLGRDGPVAGVYPDSGGESLGQVITQETLCYVQVFNQWDDKIDPEQAVSPGIIEGWAQRFRRACEDDGEFVGNENLWYYRVTKIAYPHDPTGNITRFVATVMAWSENAAVTETSS